MNIPGKLKLIAVLLDQDGFVAAPKQRAVCFAQAIVTLGVLTIDVSH